MAKTFIIRLPEDAVDLSGTVSGHEIKMFVDKATSRLLLDFNATMLKYEVTDDTSPPPPPPPPKPIEYATYHTLRAMNIRPQPTTDIPEVGSAVTHQNLELSTEIVTPDFLQRIGKPTYAIKAGFEWRHIKDDKEEHTFIASKIGTTPTVALGAYKPPTPPPPTPPPDKIVPPMPLNGMKGLRLETVGDKTFLRGGQYAGVNERECIYWGHPGIAPYMKQSDWDRYFKFLADSQIKWVRCYIFNSNATIEDTEARMQAMLDRAQVHGIGICAVFFDSIGMELDTGAKHRFNLAHHRPFHTGPMEHLIRDFYTKEEWRKTLPLILRIVDKFKNHKALWMWQILNEGAIYYQPASQVDSGAFHNMIYTISKEIWERDKSTPIADGCIGPHVHAPQGVDLRTYAESYYNRNPYIHVATFHVYQDRQNPGGLGAGEAEVLIGMEAAQETGRATGYTESGGKVNRLAWLRGLFDRAITQGGASFIFQWAFELDPPFNKGIGDNDYGWGNKNFNDFEAFRLMLVEMGNRLRSR